MHGKTSEIRHDGPGVFAGLRPLRMASRTMGGKYTLWLDDQNRPAVIWAFKDAQTDYTGKVTDLEAKTTALADGNLAVKAGHVYLLGER